MVDMRQIYACVDQLDLAAQRLKDAGPYSSRIALILTDNAVELMLHRRCREYSLERYSSGDRPTDKEVKSLDEALGQRFEDKPKFCCKKLKVISELERDFILTAHKYRSEASANPCCVETKDQTKSVSAMESQSTGSSRGD